MSDPRANADRPRSLVPPEGWLTPAVADDVGPGAAYLLLVTAIALVLRLWRLDGMSLWIDEVFTWEMASPAEPGGFLARTLDAYQGPLYHAAVWPLLRWRDSAFMLRLPAAVAGTLSVPLLGLFAARLWDRRTGRLAALLLALSPFAVWYSQEARGYSFLIFFAVASGVVLVDALRRGPTPGRAILLALLVFGGLGSNFAFAFLVLAFALTVVLVAPPRDGRTWLLWGVALGGGVLLAAPWLLKAAGIWEVGRVVPGAATGAALRGESTFSPWAVPFTGFALFYGFSLGPSLAELHAVDRLAAIRPHLPVILLGAGFAAAALLPSLTRLQRRRWTLLLWILIPLAAVALLAMRNVKPYNVRYAAAAFPWVVALTAAGLCRLPRWPRLVTAVGLCVLMAVSLVGMHLDGRYAKADVRGAVAALDPAADAGRPILVTTVGPVVRYYWNGVGPVLGCGDEPQIQDAAMADGLVARQLGGADTAWVIWARSWFLDPRHLLPQALTRQGTLERIHEGPGVAVDLWRRRVVERGNVPVDEVDATEGNAP